jgi:hypothetical protein
MCKKKLRFFAKSPKIRVYSGKTVISTDSGHCAVKVFAESFRGVQNFVDSSPG